MENEEKQDERVLYGEETNSDSVRLTALAAEVLLILSAIAAAVRLIVFFSDKDRTPVGVVLALFALLFGIWFAVLIGNTLRELSLLMEKNAKLEAAVRYLEKTHNFEIKAHEEAPPDEIPGSKEDSFESMRIEEDGVHFRKVGAIVKCPFCDSEQPAGYEACENCGQRFFFED